MLQAFETSNDPNSIGAWREALPKVPVDIVDGLWHVYQDNQKCKTDDDDGKREGAVIQTGLQELLEHCRSLQPDSTAS